MPAIVLLLSIILAVYFYRLLPADVAYHFSAGIPDRWMSRSVFILWTLVPQLLFALVAASIIFIAVKVSARLQPAAGLGAGLDTLLLAMGNMVALPQLIISFAMLNIFSYNAYKVQILSLWLFALIIMVLGGILLGLFFVKAFLQIRRPSGTKPLVNSKEQ